MRIWLVAARGNEPAEIRIYTSATITKQGPSAELSLGRPQSEETILRLAKSALLVAFLFLPGLALYCQQAPAPGPQGQVPVQLAAKYVGSRACQGCHADIYARWQKTPMANVVRDPREHPEAIIPDLATNNVKKFTIGDIGLVYGSIWKQRYFTKIGDDYYPQPSQWDIMNHVWRPYFVA